MSLWLWGPVWLYMGGIFYVSSRPDVTLPGALPDKPWHILAYLGLGLLMVRALAGGLGARVAARTAVLGALLATAYGVTDEIHQMFVPGRTAEPYDVVADAIGAAIGASLVWLWGIISPSRHGL